MAPPTPSMRPALCRIVNLPSGLVAATCRSDLPKASAEDLQLTTGWARNRRREFLRGRAAARRALLKIGTSASAIPIADDGAPIWPAGVIGSIAHKRGLALVVAGRRTDFIAVGVDLDLDDDRDAKRAAEYGTEDELTGARQVGVTTPASMLFVAKEAVYKCVSGPFAARTLDFHDVSVAFTHPGRMVATVPSLGIELRGCVLKRGVWLAAVVWLQLPQGVPGTADSDV
jgi:4'-phosphopantetheinyl transferase EntD